MTNSKFEELSQFCKRDFILALGYSQKRVNTHDDLANVYLQ